MSHHFESPIDDVLDKLSNVSANGSSARCPVPDHADRNNSLSISEGDEGRVLLKCHRGCELEDIVEALDMEMSDLFPRRKRSVGEREKSVQRRGCTLAEYAEVKRLPLDFLKELGLRDAKRQGAPAVRIPYMNAADDEVLAMRYRLSMDEGEQRFAWKTGNKTCLYGLWVQREFQDSEYIVLVEGESDCHTLWHHEIPALGVPGATNWKDERDAPHFDDFKVIYVVVEPGDSGETLLKSLSDSRIRERVRLVRLGELKDPSGLYMANPKTFEQDFTAALDAAIPWEDEAAAERQARRDEAWAKCKKLATRFSILDDFAADLKKSGVVGEERNAKLLYLALTSRLLDRPVSVAVKGPSSTGKSYLVKQVCKFFPRDATKVLTAASERALAYSEEPLKHRMVVLEEAGGIQGEVGTLIVKSLLSEGCINYETVEKTKDGLKPKRILREGPTGLLTTTTKVRLDKELETRLLSLRVDDSTKHTRDVMTATATRRAPVDVERWLALQDWISSGAANVVVHYGKELALQTSPGAPSMRRAFFMVLSLIESSALLHQSTRARDGEGNIIANMSDYIDVWTVVHQPLSIGMGLSVSPETRETVRAVEELCRDEVVNQLRLAEHMRLHKSTISRRVDTAMEEGYLVNEDDRPRRFQLVPGKPLPDDRSALPDPDDFFHYCEMKGCRCYDIDAAG